VSNRGLHMPVSGSALAMQGVLRHYVRMAYVTQIDGRNGWYMRYRGVDGKYKFHKGGDTKEEAETNLQLRLGKLCVVRAGMVSRQTYNLAEHAKRNIGEHLKLYIASLKGRKRSDAHIEQARTYIGKWIEECEVATLEDVDAVRCEAWLAEMIDGGKVGYRTRNAYLTRAKEFEARPACGQPIKAD
jgi:hypothetical protein